MKANKVLTRYPVKGGYIREENFIGTPDECCATCFHWMKKTQEHNGPGEGPCKKADGATTWGGALCEDFLRRKGKA